MAVDADCVVLVFSLLERSKESVSFGAFRFFEENHYFIHFNRRQIHWTLFSIF